MSSPGRETSSSAAPRMSWERMTPLLPRAPSSAARATDSTISSRRISSSGRSTCGQPVDLLQARLKGQGHVVARVAVGDREHVEVVDLLAARLQVRQGAFERDAEADEARVRHGAVP